MPLFHINGKLTKGSRLSKRERSTRHRHERVINSDTYLRDLRLQLHNYHMRQNRRWLTAKIHTEGNEDIPQHARWPLMQHWKKTEQHQQNPKITDGQALTDDVKAALDLLRDERAVAAAQQGNPERVADWWVQPEIKSKKKEKKRKNAQGQGTTAGRRFDDEAIRNGIEALNLGEETETVEEEKGSALSEEGFQGFNSPIMMSPTGPVVGGEDED